MIEDVIEGSAKTILKGILRFLFTIFVECFLFYTGEIVLFIITLGNRKPRWDYYSRESASKFVIFTELSTWLGFAFWLFIAWLINAKFLSQ